jgi:hypothetical protein
LTDKERALFKELDENGLQGLAEADAGELEERVSRFGMAGGDI